MQNKELSLTIGWLYPDLMSTYGDRGNVIILEKRCQWRGIEVVTKRISVGEDAKDILSCDFLLMGGAQDHQQEIVNLDLQKSKGAVLIDAIQNGISGLFICGAYQFLGDYYLTADGKKLKGLGLFDLYTESPGLSAKRLIGNIIINSNLKTQNSKLFVGFENHGGRTYLSDKSQAFAMVVKGFGNNGEDRTEGIRYKNAIGTYLHGPILSKNPELADYLLQRALERKYGEEIILAPLDDEYAHKAKQKIIGY